MAAKTDKNIISHPHGFEFGASYEDYSAALKDMLLNSNEKLDNANKSLIDGYIDELVDITTPLFMDTSVGGNDVLNPYPCGNEDDDIIFPLNAVDKKCNRGLGYVYKEVIQDTQKVLWLTFGVPRFSDLEGFYGFKDDPNTSSEYAKAVNEGNDTKNAWFFGKDSKFGAFVGDTLSTAGRLVINLPFLPIRSYNWISDQVNNDEITKYYDFEPAMIQYYKQVNSVIGELAVGMNLYGNGDASGSSVVTNAANVVEEVVGAGSNATQLVNPGATETSSAERVYNDAIPEILRDGPDIFAIINKRQRWQNGKTPIRNMDTPDNLVETAFNWAQTFSGAALGADQFIGFRVEKSTDTYESITNTTGESQIAATLNNTSQEVRAAMFSFMGASFGGEDTLFGRAQKTVSDLGKSAVDLISSAVGRPNFTGTATTLFTGNGYFDIPEVWKSSSFTKSYTFSIELESRLGDNVSIFQNLYVPLACLIAAATPRAVGKNMYTSPYILQAYCQGMFAIPLGMIDSITIKRGSADYGWNIQGLPTTINVSFTIKDLSPALFLSLYGEGFLNIFKNNSSMHEYLATLSGLGLAERKRYGKRLMRRYNAALLLHRTTTFNPLYWATNWGSSRFVRNIGLAIGNKWPNN